MSTSAIAAPECSGCGTALAPTLLACPGCRALVHRERLQMLATQAADQAAGGELVEAKATWDEALSLLPASTRQHAEIIGRIEGLDARIRTARLAGQTVPTASAGHPAWRRWLATGGAVVLLLLGKLKFLALGLSKAGTFFSMLAFFGVYWTQFGWPLALGLVVSIYVHEMGHVAALRHHGIAAGAPFFIPGIGALVRLRQRIADPVVNAAVGLAGPVWGVGAALAAWLVFLATKAPVWAAIAHLGAYINLFNLIPVWQLDGARGMFPLTRPQRLAVTASLGVAFLLTQERLLVIVALVALWRAVRHDPGAKGDRPTMLLFIALVGALAALSMVRG